MIDFIKTYKIYFYAVLCVLCFGAGFKLSSFIYQADISNIEKANLEQQNKIINDYVAKQKEQSIKDQKVVDDLNKKLDDISVNYNIQLNDLQLTLNKNKSKLDACVLPKDSLDALNKSF